MSTNNETDKVEVMVMVMLSTKSPLCHNPLVTAECKCRSVSVCVDIYVLPEHTCGSAYFSCFGGCLCVFMHTSAFSQSV